MGRKCQEWAEKKGDLEHYKDRQKDVEHYWDKVDEEIIKPILEEYNDKVRSILEKALYLHGEEAEEAVQSTKQVNAAPQQTPKEHNDAMPPPTANVSVIPTQNYDTEVDQTPPQPDTIPDETSGTVSSENPIIARRNLVTEAVKRLRQAYLTAKRAYRLPHSRLSRISDALSRYHGTKNYHNFTVAKSFRDPSAKRVIKSFAVSGDPILINGTEWLSLKVHGQSFMMHQIRKMVGMVALVVRCGADPKRIFEALGPESISIPKAPALGLLLERPVFDSYNRRAGKEFGKEDISFEKFRKEMDEFKQKEIYERMYRDEEKDNVFGAFFNHIDNFPERTFLYVTSGGIEATKEDPNAGAEAEEGAAIDRDTSRQQQAAEGGEDSDAEEGDDKLGAEG